MSDFSDYYLNDPRTSHVSDRWIALSSLQKSSAINCTAKEGQVMDYKELTEREAAAELRISIDTLQRERAAGRISFARRRRRVFYPVGCIEEYRQAQVTRECPTTSRTTSASSETGRPGTGTARTVLDDARLAARWARRIKN
jgi:hypothetical protein